MPNRILKESICTSNNLDTLPAQAEVFFYRLLVNCDDYGRIDGRYSILRAKCFPLKLDTVKDKDIESWLTIMANQKLIRQYSVNGGNYLQITTWEQHQQIRAQRSKYPAPDDNSIEYVSNGNQLIADDIRFPRNPIQSESNPNPNTIFSLWNEQKIKVHKKLTPDITYAITKILKVHSEEEVCRVIKNYSEIVTHPETYWFGYKWSLKDFLSRGFDKFDDIEVAKANYKSTGGNGHGANQGNTQGKGTHLIDRDKYTEPPYDPRLANLTDEEVFGRSVKPT